MYLNTITRANNNNHNHHQNEKKITPLKLCIIIKIFICAHSKRRQIEETKPYIMVHNRREIFFQRVFLYI
jgi:hypothetical protein